MKQNFFSIWTNYRKLLKQRNSALSQRVSKREIDTWNEALLFYANQYTELRENFIIELSPYFREFAEILLGEQKFSISYVRGWPKDKDLVSCLEVSYVKDSHTGRTEYGPHRADFKVIFNNMASRDIVSRGQEKLLVYALNLAQIALLKDKLNTNTLMLLDDLGSELDQAHASKLLMLLNDRFEQVCITTANLETLPLECIENIKLFHVEHGEISEFKV